MNLAIVALDLVRKISQGLAEELQRLVTRINAWALVDHRPSGRHHFPWTPIPFDAARFTGNGTMTWTATQASIVNLSYRKIDNVVTLVAFIQSTTVGGVPNTTLQLQLPTALTARIIAHSPLCRGVDAAVFTSVWGQVLGGTSVLNVRRLDGVAWTAGTAAFSLVMDFEVAESAT